MDEREEFAKRVGAMLARMRKMAGLTQEDLGARLGKSHSYVTRAETAARGTDLADMYLWARACDLDPRSYLAMLGGEEPPDMDATRSLASEFAELSASDRERVADLVGRLRRGPETT